MSKSLSRNHSCILRQICVSLHTPQGLSSSHLSEHHGPDIHRGVDPHRKMCQMAGDGLLLLRSSSVCSVCGPVFIIRGAEGTLPLPLVSTDTISNEVRPRHFSHHVLFWPARVLLSLHTTVHARLFKALITLLTTDIPRWISFLALLFHLNPTADYSSYPLKFYQYFSIS